MDKQKLLEQFQEITGIEDIGASMFYLEASDWDMQAAVFNGLAHAHDGDGTSSSSTGAVAAAAAAENSKRSTFTDKNKNKAAQSSSSSDLNEIIEIDINDQEFKPKRNPFAALKKASSNSSDSDSDDFQRDLRKVNSPLSIGLSNHSDYSSHSNRVPLIPSDCDSFEEASENFVRVFEARYGDTHPFFNPVPLEAAFTELQTVNFRNRKPLLLYLHDDNSISSQLFCTQVLCMPAMVEFINTSFTTWAWDLTFPENRTKLIDWIQTCLGHQNSLPIRVITRDEFPALVVYTKTRQAIENICLIKKTVSLEEVMVKLMGALEICQAQLRFEEAESLDRQHRQRVVSEQELAYEESLAADKLKEEEKTKEEQRKEAELRQKMEHETKKEKERKRIEQQVLPEPPENTESPVTNVRIRLPKGETIVRRFLLSSELKSLFDFAASKGFSIVDHKLLTNFPNRDLTSLDPKMTFKDLNFSTRETIVIEQK